MAKSEILGGQPPSGHLSYVDTDTLPPLSGSVSHACLVLLLCSDILCSGGVSHARLALITCLNIRLRNLFLCSDGVAKPASIPTASTVILATSRILCIVDWFIDCVSPFCSVS